ncbi:MAG: PilZ domain-containing protein [Desulfobulbaceae bacterium]|nr:PilZ domain-containing protein [Desulfobulbaceae bacterium]
MSCHYLNKTSFECSLTKGGLFLPLQAHFDQFCMTDDFMQCEHYNKLISASGGASCSSSSRVSDLGRRQFARKREQFLVDLGPCERSGSVTADCEEKAYVIDYSQGGVRVRVAKPLSPHDGMLNFKFGYDFIVPQLEGFATVRWQKPCHGKEDGPWEAGLAFESHFVKAMIAVQMTP